MSDTPRTFRRNAVALRLAALALMLTAVCACAQSKLPRSRPAEASLGFRESGGRVPFGVTFANDGDRGAYQLFDDGARVDVHGRVDASRLDEAYRLIRARHIDEITMRTANVMDRGGTTIQLSIGKVNYLVSDNGRQFVDDAWRDDYDASLAAVRALVYDSGAAKSPAVTITWDEASARRRVQISADLGGEALALTEPTPRGHTLTLFSTKPFEVTAREAETGTSAKLTIDPSTTHAVRVSVADGVSIVPVP